MSTTLKVYVNTSASDVALNTSGSDWVEVDTTNDKLLFTKGDSTVTDGASIPTATQLNSSAPILNGTEYTIPKYFLQDASSSTIKEIDLMGSGNYRYVMAFDFDGSTVSEPTLEVWDDSDLDSVSTTPLGGGTPASSWYRGIVTTSALPGSGWTGTRLAGSSTGYYLNLNNGSGALSSATTLYCQLKIVIPATQTDGGTSSPVIAIKFATV